MVTFPVIRGCVYHHIDILKDLYLPLLPSISFNYSYAEPV